MNVFNNNSRLHENNRNAHATNHNLEGDNNIHGSGFKFYHVSQEHNYNKINFKEVTIKEELPEIKQEETFDASSKYEEIISDNLQEHDYCFASNSEQPANEIQVKEELDLKTPHDTNHFNSEIGSEFEVVKVEGAPNVYSCELCNFYTENEQYLNSHNLIRHKGPNGSSYEYRDLFPMYTTYLSKQVEMQQNNTNGIVTFKCKECEFVTQDIHYFEIHMVSDHSSKYVPKRYHCELCAYHASYKNALKRHIKDNHAIKKMFKCELCDYKTEYKFVLHGHIQNVHSVKKPRRNLFGCDECTYSSNIQYNLVKHVVNKHAEKNDSGTFKCKYCCYSPELKSILKTHMLQEHTKKLVTVRRIVKIAIEKENQSMIEDDTL